MNAQLVERMLDALKLNDSKNPMRGFALAQRLDMDIEAFENLMSQVCDIVPAPINRARIERSDYQGFVYWPTGIVDKSSWEKFTPAKARKNNDALFAGNPIRTETAATSTPVATATAERPAIQFNAEEYSEKPMAYRVLKLIEANPGHTDREIQIALGLAFSINSFLKTYTDHVDYGDHQGKRTYTLTKPVHEFYGTRKRGTKPGALNTVSAALSIEPTDHQVERLAVAIEQISKPIAVGEEAEIETGLPFRCAYTSDACLMFFLQGEVEPIELTPAETTTVIDFISDRIMPIAVEIV